MSDTSLNSVNPENIQPVQASEILSVQEPTHEQLVGNLSIESIDTAKGEYLDLYQKQNEVSKALEQRAEENNIRDIDGSKMYFNPDRLKFDDDMIIYSTGMLSAPAHLFQKTESSFKEISLLPEKTGYFDNRTRSGLIPRNINKIRNGIYCVELVHLENGLVKNRGGISDAYLSDNRESYMIDKTGKVLEQMGQLGDFIDNTGIHSRHTRKNHRGFQELDIEEYDLNGKFKSKSTTIFGDNMEKLFIIPDVKRYYLQYCDNQVAICHDTKQDWPRKYVVFDKTGIIAQGTEDELKSNEHMQKFLEKEEIRQKKRKENEEKEREKRRLPFGERFKEINHCVLSLNEKGDIATIQNDEGKTIYEITDVLDFYEDDYRPEFRTSNGNMRITERNQDSGVLCIHKYVGGYAKKAIFINKTTGEKLEFDGFKGENSILQGRLIEVFVNSHDSEIYDENLNKLGMRIWSGYGLYAIARQENGEIKVYLYNLNTGKELFEIKKESSNNIVKRAYKDEEGQYHLIIEKKDGALIEVAAG